ncbi:MAG: ABC transporter substrate-binding protein [Gemmatimonadota bacterium]
MILWLRCVVLAAIGCLIPRGVPAVEVARTLESGREAIGAWTDTVRVRDDLNHLVRLAAPARRIVSLSPAFTEILFAMGAGDRLVGRTRFGTRPEAARAVPSIGDGVRPSVELVLARRPDVVLFFAGSDNAGLGAALRRVGVPSLGLAHNSLADLNRNLRRLGVLIGCEAAASRLAAAIERGLKAVHEATAGLGATRVYYDVWSDPPITVGKASYLDSLLAIAGGRNVFGDLEAVSPQVSLEAIAARDPQLILWPVTRTGDRRSPPEARPGWRAIGAVRRGAVRRVNGDRVHVLGPGIVAGALELARALHPAAAIDGIPEVGADPSSTCSRDE